jgi:hypothetical protein
MCTVRSTGKHRLERRAFASKALLTRGWNWDHNRLSGTLRGGFFFN